MAYDFEQFTDEQRRKAGRSSPSPRTAGTPPVAGPVKFGGTGAGVAAWGIGDQVFNNPRVAQGREQAFANANRIIDEKFLNSDRKMFGVQFGTPGKSMPKPAMPQAPVERPVEPRAGPQESVRQNFGAAVQNVSAANKAEPNATGAMTPKALASMIDSEQWEGMPKERRQQLMSAYVAANTGQDPAAFLSDNGQNQPGNQYLNIHGTPLQPNGFKGHFVTKSGIEMIMGAHPTLESLSYALPASEYRQLLAKSIGVTDDKGQFQSFGGFNPAYGADALDNQRKELDNQRKALDNQRKALAIDQQKLLQQALPAFGVNKAGELYQKDGEGAVEFNEKMAGRSMKNDATQAWIDFYDDKTTEEQRSKIAEYLRENDPSGWLEHQKKRAQF